jgi:D-inositol-3-phosphate glycosyltransferase
MSVYLRELTARLVDFPDVSVDLFTRAQNPICVETKDISPQIRVVQLKGGPEYPIDRKDLFEFIPEFSANLEEYIHRNKIAYDVIHSHYWLSGLAGGYIRNRLGKPLVNTYHTLGFMKKRVLGEREHERRENAEQYVAQTADVIISPSSEERQCLVDEYGILPAKVKVVHPGVNPRIFYPIGNRTILQKLGYQKDAFVLLYVGRIEKVKGLMNVIEALPLLKDKNLPLLEKIKLIVIGGGKKEEFAENKEVSRIKRYMEQNGLENKVVFLGSIDQSHLRKYYSAADALVVPSLYESFGLVTVEALACGTPVVVSQIDKMKSIVKDGKNGFSFCPGDPVSLSQSLENVFVHCRRLWSGSTIRQDVLQRFSWDTAAEDTYRIYEDLINRRSWTKTIFQPDGSPQPV